jgi:chemotaxis protein methyltransferase CheR
MALSEAGWFQRARIEIHASDGSRMAIAKARQAVYRPRSFRALPADLREKYFVEGEKGASPSPELSARITSWSVVNLMDRPDVLAHGPMDVIFCRNAFIYFSSDAIRQTVDTFAQVLPVPGYLFVGASESLLNVTDKFMLDDIERAFVYVKR